MASDEKQWASIREAFVYWANKRKANSVRSYASVREAILALANNESKYSSGGGGDLGGLFTIIYTTDETTGEEIVDYAIGNEEFLFAKDLKILTEEAAELFNSTRYSDDPYVLQDGDIINISDLLRHLILEDITPEPEEPDDPNAEPEEEETERVLRIRAFEVQGLYSDGYISARGVDDSALSIDGGIDEEELWDILEAAGNNEQINLAHLSDLQDWVDDHYLAKNGTYHFLTESELLSDYLIWGQRFAVDTNTGKKVITGDMTYVGNITMSGSITMGANADIILGPINNYLNSNVGFYSNSFVSARGVDPTPASGGSEFDVDEMWDELATEDSTHKIDNSHLNSDIVTTSVLNSTLANYLDINGLETELSSYTIWGQHFVNQAITGNMSNVGNISMIGNISYVGNLYFDSNNAIYLSAVNSYLQSSVGFNSLSFVSARGVDNTAGSGSSFDVDEMWDELASVDSTKIIDNSHITGFVTLSQLNSILPSEIQNTLSTYTVWGRTLVPVTNGDLDDVEGISMSGNITITSNSGNIYGLSAIYFGSGNTKSISLQEPYLNSSVGFYSSSFISSRGLDPSAASNSNFDESDMWDLLGNTTSGHYINAYLIPIGSGLSISGGRLIATGGGGGGGGTTYYAGNGINIDSNDHINVVSYNTRNIGSTTVNYGGTTSNRYYGVEIDTSSNKLFVNVPWLAQQHESWNGSTYIDVNNSTNTIELDIRSLLGTLTGGTWSHPNYKINYNTNGELYTVVPWTDTNYYHTRLFASGLQISTGTGVDNMYVPYATSSQIGALKLSAGSNIDSITYSSGTATINAKDTTYTNGTGISIGTGNAINHSNSITAQTTQALYPIKYDAQGHITAAGTAVTPLVYQTPSAYSVLYATSASTYSFSTNPTVLGVSIRRGTGTGLNEQTITLSCDASGSGSNIEKWLSVNGTLKASGNLTVGGNVTVVGNVTSTSGRFFDASDIRLKKNIEEIKDILKSIENIPIVRYRYISNPKSKYIGTLAQNLLESFPDLVYEGDDGFYSVDYDGLAAIAIQGIKELSDRIKKIEDKIYGSN